MSKFTRSIVTALFVGSLAALTATSLFNHVGEQIEAAISTAMETN